jgi:hypothetical protein
MPPTINDLRVYVPAKNYGRSRRFYTALGFTPSPGWGDTTDFELNGQCFRLQNHYVKEWAANFMVVIGVDDVDAWHQHTGQVVAEHGFQEVCITPPESVGDSRVLHVTDPSGVLLVFVQ